MSIGICYTHKLACIDGKWISTEDIEPDDYIKDKKIKGTVSNELCPKCKKNKQTGSGSDDGFRKCQGDILALNVA